MKLSPARSGALFFCIALAISSLSVSCAQRHNDELRLQAKSQTLEIHALGADSFDAVNLSLKNSGSADASIYVPAGIVLNSENKDASSMIVLTDCQLSVPAKGEKSQTLRAFCTDFKKLTPTAKDNYDVKGYKPSADKNIQRLASYLGSEKGKKSYDLENEDTRSTVQQTIWLITEGITYDKNMDYMVDSYMFSSLLQQNPSYIALFLEDPTKYTSADDVQNAVLSLMKDRVRLNDKLKTLFVDKYEGIAAGLRQQLQENQGVTERDGVNTLLSRAHINLTY
jgi:hypothetical protein